jgi:hypothetical protein
MVMKFLGETYPDSVNLVRPPKTTIPKTLVALPRSQYATDFELVSGKNFLRAEVFTLPTFWLSEANGEGAAIVLLARDEAAVLPYRIVRSRVDFAEILDERGVMVLDRH